MISAPQPQLRGGERHSPKLAGRGRRLVSPPLLLTAVVAATGLPASGQQIAPPAGPVRVPVRRIQAPEYVPPPPVSRRPWWFTVQTVWGPGAVVPVARVARYQPQPFRFPANAPVLAGKPILPPAGTPPSQWAAAAPLVPPPQPAEPAEPAVPPPAPPTPPRPTPPAAAAPVARDNRPSPSVPETRPPPRPSGNWATVAIDASEPQPNALAVTIPATPGSTVAAGPAPAAAVAARPVSRPPPPARAAPAPAAVAWWRCVGVTDGDTLTCLDAAGRQQKLRVAAVDAPELGQAYGREARELLAELVFGKRIAVSVSGRDDAGRLAGAVSVDGRDVAATLVKAGAAWADPQTGSNLAAEQQQARQAKTGLWAGEAPLPPWEFRNGGAGLQPAA